MTHLFDISPPEGDGQKKKKSRKPKAQEAAPEAAPQPQAVEPTAYRPATTLGRLDDHITCHRCQAACHDIVEDYSNEWLIECNFCGLKEWTPSIKGFLKSREDEFQFRDGRYAGSTLDEASATPRGRDYIAWAAKEHKRQAVREACAKWLLTAGVPVA